MSAALFARFAIPTDPDLDVFGSGVAEVDAYFRSRQWFDVAKGYAAPPTYQFLTEEGGEVVGYAACAYRNAEHASDASTERARYLVIYAVGVHVRFQGLVNPRAENETYAAALFRVLETFARDKEGCVGLSLWVRNDNARAIAFYTKLGFVADPGGAVPRDDRAPHLTMRKPLS